jgi:prevent-host-death family protein
MAKRINIATDIIPVSEFRRNTAAIMKRLKTEKRPIILTQNGKSAAVLVDAADYEEVAFDDSVLLEGIHRGEADIRAGRVLSDEEAMSRLAKWL